MITAHKKPEITKDEKEANKLMETFKLLADQEKQKKLTVEAKKPDFGQNLYD